MKLVKQGYNECALATMAMLAEVTLEEARAVAAKIAWKSPQTFSWQEQLEEYFPGWIATPQQTLAWDAYASKVCLALGITPFSTRAQKDSLVAVATASSPDLRGKGYIGLQFVWHGHAIAYENGLIYDPDTPSDYEPMSWEAYRQYRRKQGLQEFIAFIVEPVSKISDTGGENVE